MEIGITTDWFLKQGYSHKVCEDYAFNGNDFVVLSDGCSMSDFTDYGARTLCFSAAGFIQAFGKKGGVPDYNIFKHQVLGTSVSNIKSLGLPLTSLDATLLVAFIEGPFIKVYVYGDGYICTTDVYENKTFYQFEYSNNAPEYLTYELDPKRKETYLEEFGGELTVLKSECLGNWEEIEPVNSFKFAINEFKTITLSSDGVASFTAKNKGFVETMNPIASLNDFVSFKNFKGEFVRRRANKAIKTFEKVDIRNYDDLSIVGIHIEEVK